MPVPCLVGDHAAANRVTETLAAGGSRGIGRDGRCVGVEFSESNASRGGGR
jgi:hypothetical protein